MHPDLERLIRLQALDTQAAEARKAQTTIPDTQRALDAKLEGARARVAAARERLAANQTTRRTLEKDVAAVQTRLSRYKDQLMEVKTNREYHAMQHEIETAPGEVKRVEDLMLEHMLEADEIAASLKAAEAELNVAEEQITKEHAELEQKLASAAVSLESALARRGVLIAEIPGPIAALYEQLVRGRKGVAVVAAKDERCSECHVRMRPQIFVQVRQNSGIVQCDSCQRILYYVPPQAAAATPTEAQA